MKNDRKGSIKRVLERKKKRLLDFFFSLEEKKNRTRGIVHQFELITVEGGEVS